MVTEILQKEVFSKEDIIQLLSITEPKQLDLLRQKAYQVMQDNVGDKVYYRGLLEFSNMCTYDCLYCGIRKSNSKNKRYLLEKNEIIKVAKWCADAGYGSIVLQSGQRDDQEFIDFVTDITREIKKVTKSTTQPDGLGITLCVGEQKSDTYKKFYDAGAHRYLLRIETTNPKIFENIHDNSQSITKRMEAITNLKQLGFKTGTGIMIGLPNQTVEDLTNDILYFKENNIDMIGMGPFIVHHETPLKDLQQNQQEIFNLSLKMIAVTRIVMKNINIAATTALQALDPLGREKGLKFGANIVMPLVTPKSARKNYLLYDNKPCIDEEASDCKDCLANRIKSIGRTVGWNEWGDF